MQRRSHTQRDHVLQLEDDSEFKSEQDQKDSCIGIHFQKEELIN